jgi:phage repressor protein C with HTH and peptisase S24 domain
MKLFKISGSSMSPTLNDGEILLSKRPHLIKVGFIYVINHTDLGVIVKRLKDQKNNKYFFEGDNLKLSTPSSVIGPVSRERIIGQAICSLGRKRIRRL